MEEIEKQEHLADTGEKNYKIADENEAMKRFYEEIEPQYAKLFERLAKL
ncbi:MAG TPA: hypothetical protein VGL94_12595 [Ktedonobacteraceae bacterium]